MLQAVESGASDGQFAIWEAPRPIVVLGRNNAPDQWVDEDACRRDGIDVLRRCSGGGAVVLGHGCVNYAVAMPFVSRPELVDVAASVRFVLRHIVEALGVPGLRMAGSADLAIGGRKVSGNAQRRGRSAFLQHGTLLYDFDPQLATSYLREPRRQPAYRRGRSHDQFVTNLPVARAIAGRALAQACTVLVVSSQRGCSRPEHMPSRS